MGIPMKKMSTSEKIIRLVRINDSSYMPNDLQLKEDISALIKEAGYFLEEADLMGKYIDKGWIPPEEVRKGNG